jgi:hypothetical protein
MIAISCSVRHNFLTLTLPDTAAELLWYNVNAVSS